MTIGELIKEYRAEHGLSQRQFAKRCDLSNGYIAMLERGENPSTGEPIKSTIPALKKIATGMGISLNMLFSTVEDIGVSMGDEMPLPDNVIHMPGTRQVPRLGAIACGEPILAENNIEGYDEVPDWVKCDFTLTCKGDSMINARIHDGDVVFIKAQPEVESGQIAAVLIDGEFESEATLKRVRYTEDGIVLWPENPRYEPKSYTGAEAERVRILGLATHFVGKVV